MNTVELDLNHLTSSEDNGQLIIDFTGVTENYVSSNLLNEINKYSANQPLLYRHNHPLKKKGGEIIGRIIQTSLTDVKDTQGKLVKAVTGKAFIGNKTKFQRMVQDYVKKKDQIKNPVKISIGFENIENEKHEPIDAQVYEYSLTYQPVCEECVTKMPEKDVEISELQTALDKSAGLTKEFEKKNKELESKITEMEKTMKDKDSKIKEFEDKLINTKDLSVKIAELERKLSDAEKKPFIDEIYELEKDDELKEIYRGWDTTKLQKRLDKVRGLRANIVTEPLNKSREKAVETEQVMKNMKEIKLENLDPSVANAIKEMM